MWGGGKGATKDSQTDSQRGCTKGDSTINTHTKGFTKDCSRRHKGIHKGNHNSGTTAGPQRDNSRTTTSSRTTRTTAGQPRQHRDNNGPTAGQPGQQQYFFVAPMSCITRVSLSSGRPRAAQPHHLQRRLEESKDTMAEPVRANLAEPGHANLAKPGHANACNQCLVGLAGPIRLRGRHKVGTAGHRALARMRTAPIARGSVRR